MKMPTIVGIFLFVSREFSCSAVFSKKNLRLLVICDLLAGRISYSAELSANKIFITSGPDAKVLELFHAQLS